MSEIDRPTVLKMIPYSVHIVGLTDGEKIVAYTGAWLMQCSFEPPLVVIGIKRGTTAYQMVDRAKAFSVNFLDKSRSSTAEYFFHHPEQRGDHLGTVPFKRGSTGSPIIESSSAYMECEIEKRLDAGGDHILLVGRVVDAAVLKKGPVLTMEDTSWHYGGYRVGGA